MPAVYIDVQQGTEVWHGLREKKVTASEAQKIATGGSGFITYLEKVKRGERSNFTTKYTERGKELESYAKQAYEITRGVKLYVTGIVLNPTISNYAGASPDGFTSDKKIGAEIKCLKEENHEAIKAPKKAHWWQAQMQILICEFEAVDIVYYCPRKELKIYRVVKDFDAQIQLTRGIKRAEKELSTM